MKLKRAMLLLFTLFVATVAVVAQNSKQELNDQLWEAARRGDAAAVTALLDKGADVNAKFRYGTTALFKAADAGHTEVVKVLLDRGADVTVKDTFYGATAMTWALSNKHVEIVRALLTKDSASAGEVLTNGANEGNVELVKMALEKGGIKPETMTAAYVGALADKDKAQIAELLKNAGAKPPLEIDAATLRTYAGKYKSEQGNEVVVSAQEGKLTVRFGGQALMLMPIDKSTFRPIAFEGLTVTFNAEGGKVTNFSLKQASSTSVYKKIEETTQP